jgi:hypothetical protein
MANPRARAFESAQASVRDANRSRRKHQCEQGEDQADILRTAADFLRTAVITRSPST